MWSFDSVVQADIDSVLEIQTASFRHPWSAVLFLDELSCKDARAYALRHDEKIVGYIFYRLIFEEMHIFKVAVQHQWRLHGLASLMLEKSLNLALDEGAEAAFLEVRPSNFSALALYRKFGFQIIGKRPGYYPETGEDGLVLMKRLNTIS